MEAITPMIAPDYPLPTPRRAAATPVRPPAPPAPPASPHRNTDTRTPPIDPTAPPLGLLPVAVVHVLLPLAALPALTVLTLTAFFIAIRPYSARINPIIQFDPPWWVDWSFAHAAALGAVGFALAVVGLLGDRHRFALLVTATANAGLAITALI